MAGHCTGFRCRVIDGDLAVAVLTSEKGPRQFSCHRDDADTPSCHHDRDDRLPEEMITSLRNARREISRHLDGADPDRVTSAQAASLVELFAEIERLGAAGRVLYAKRAAESLVWRDEGHRSAAEWMAAKTK